MAAAAGLETPFKPAGGDDCASKSYTGRRLKPSRRRCVMTVILAIFVYASVFSQPVMRCYQNVAHKLSHDSMSFGQPRTFEQRARRVLSKTPLIDGHIDFPILVRALYGNHVESRDFKDPFENGNFPQQLDLPRLKQAQSGGAFWSVFAPCPEDGADFSDENYASSVQYTLDQIDVMNRIQLAYPERFSQKVDSSTAMSAFRQGKLISPLGVEGLHQIGNKVSNLRMFHALGVRYATLTHNCHNKFADAAVLDNPQRKAEPEWGGISPLGQQLIREMNRIGMIVDISHVSDDTMRDVLQGKEGWDGSKAPVIYSHSSAWSICPHPRNVKDEILQLVKMSNSLVMVNVAPDFISCVDKGNANGIPETVPENATIERVADHIVHIGSLIGYDHVGIGTDFDGIPTVPKGFEDVTKYPELVAQLLKRGVSDSDAGKIVGGNLLRVWRDVDAVSATMKAEGIPAMEDTI